MRDRADQAIRGQIWRIFGGFLADFRRMPSLLHGSRKLLGELFGSEADDPDALDVVIAVYEVIGLPISKQFQLERVLKAWLR